jgi:hypothetical protein
MAKELLTYNFCESMAPKALQPNISIHAYVVAPRERREKVVEEMRRPVSSRLEKEPYPFLRFQLIGRAGRGDIEAQKSDKPK